jgi:hypothetical protein
VRTEILSVAELSAGAATCRSGSSAWVACGHDPSKACSKAFLPSLGVAEDVDLLTRLIERCPVLL